MVSETDGPGSYHALPHAEHIAQTENRWTWIADGIAGAFNHVSLHKLCQIVERNLPNEQLVALIRRSVGQRVPCRHRT